MNNEQLNFFYNEILGILDWGDEWEDQGIDPLAYCRAKINELRNIEKSYRAQCDRYKDLLHVKNEEIEFLQEEVVQKDKLLVYLKDKIGQ